MANDGRLKLRTAIGRAGHTAGLWDGSVGSARLGLELVEVLPIPRAFRTMINDQAFDLAEMALTTHALALVHGKPLSGIPVVLYRDFHQGSLLMNRRAGVREPRDLAGRRVGVRAYSQTTGVWVRGILQDDFGLDPNTVTWVTFEGAHVREYADPPNVVRAAEGKTLLGMLESGEVDGAIGVSEPVGHPDVVPLWPDPDGAAAEWFGRTRVYPANHILAVRSDLAEAQPWLAAELFELFARAKQACLERLVRDGPSSPDDRKLVQLAGLVGGDPLPYGVEANRPSLELLMRYAHEQHLLPRPYTVDELFHPSTLGLEHRQANFESQTPGPFRRSSSPAAEHERG